MSFKKLIIFVVVILAALFILSRVGSKLASRNTTGGNNSPVGNETPTPGGNEETPVSTTPGGKTLVGIIPASPDSSVTINLVTKGDPFKTARSLGAQIEYWYFGWNDIAKNGWNGPKTIISKMSDGSKSAAVISVINTTVLSQFPNGYKSLSDTGFADDYAKFVGEFASNLHPDYIFIGNEVNTYLEKHPQDVAPFETILKKAYTSIKAANPNTRVGVSISFPDSLRTGFTLAKQFGDDVDLIGYTVYGFKDPNYQFGDPQDGIDILKKVPSGVPGKAYAVLETGWNSGNALDSSEAEQAQFAKLLRQYIPTSSAEFINWFIMQDGNDCSVPARAFLPPGANPDPAKFEVFKQFLCNFGMYHADGTPKEAVAAWKNAL